MPEIRKRRNPLAPLAVNSSSISPSRKVRKLDNQSTTISRQPYVPLGPRIDHVAQPLLPWENDDRKNIELRVFELFWDSEVLDVLVQSTNAYAGEKCAGTRFGRRPWRKVTEEEIKVFLALLIYMGTKRDCGSTKFWKGQGESWIFRAMSLERFSQIKRYLHISDPKLQLTRSEWFDKLEPLNSMVQSRCQKFYLPASNITVDEMMIRFGGRSHHTYRMPSKPITEGYKVFALCDKGYTYSWIFASRSDSFAGLVLQKELTSTGSTVFQLACTLPYTSRLLYNIYMDNYFLSQALSIKLRGLGIGACGTARVNKSAFPLDLVDERKNIPWNEISGESADPEGRIFAFQWQDNSAVHFLITIHVLGPGNRITL